MLVLILLVQREAFESVRFAGGHCVVIGGAPHGSHVAVSPGDLLCGKRISGCLYGCYNFRNDLPQLVRKGPPRATSSGRARRKERMYHRHVLY